MMYMCSEKFTLEGEQLARLEQSTKIEGQETIEEDEALKGNEEDAEPISDEEEVEESEDVEGSLEIEASYQVESTGILVEADRPSMHNQTNHVDGDVNEVEEGAVIEADEADLLPPPIKQSGDRSQKRSSGRVTMPSSRLHGYELY
jgi:hypothetical protein